MFRIFSFLWRMVLTPDTALTRVDLPCATCPIVPTFNVAYLDIISGVKGFLSSRFRSSSVCIAKWLWLATNLLWAAMIRCLSCSYLLSFIFANYCFWKCDCCLSCGCYSKSRCIWFIFFYKFLSKFKVIAYSNWENQLKLELYPMKLSYLKVDWKSIVCMFLW